MAEKLHKGSLDDIPITGGSLAQVSQSSSNTNYKLELSATAAPLRKPDLVARFSTIDLPDSVDFGDNYEFTAVSQELIGTTRTYGSFYEAAYEDAISRVYGGIHVRESSVTDALPTGLNIGNFVAQNLFQPVV
jgi:hypothetical protein